MRHHHSRVLDFVLACCWYLFTSSSSPSLTLSLLAFIQAMPFCSFTSIWHDCADRTSNLDMISASTSCLAVTCSESGCYLRSSGILILLDTWARLDVPTCFLTRERCDGVRPGWFLSPAALTIKVSHMSLQCESIVSPAILCFSSWRFEMWR